MTRAKAISIVSDLANEAYTTEERLEAVVEVATMSTHREVKKDALVECLRFTLELLAANICITMDDAETEDEERE